MALFKKIVPVDKYELKNTLLKIPGVYVCEKGYCIPISDLNNAIEDLSTLDKDLLVNYIFDHLSDERTDEEEALIDESLDKLLTYNEVREYVGMDPLNGHDEYIDI